MQDIVTRSANSTSSSSRRTLSRRTVILRRVVVIYYVLLGIVMLVLVPPLVNVNRFQRRISTSISRSLGRPVHLDRVTLNLLPLPGFTLENLVVSEDPEFGMEPIIRANSVTARLRISSLWRKRVEFSSISFTEPSVNLVHLPNGKWNLQSILVQAAHIDAAPTEQKRAGPAPRFPYIEASGARLNLKLGEEKIPMALTDTEFALWLPNLQEWRVRINGHPLRTDTNASDTGTIHIEGSLRRAASLKQVPIDMQGEWRKAPLGEASQILIGRDGGLRGNMTLTAAAQGTVGDSQLRVRLLVNGLRRAEFVPEHASTLDVECVARALNGFQSLAELRCSGPTANGSNAAAVTLQGAVPDLGRPGSAKVEVETTGIPAGKILEWARAASSRIPKETVVTGLVTGGFTYDPEALQDAKWDGWLRMADVSLRSAQAGERAIEIGNLSLSRGGKPVVETARGRRGSSARASSGAGLNLAPTLLPLGGKEPAVLDGQFDREGYVLHLTGMVVPARLEGLGVAVPQFGDGLEEVLPKAPAAGPVRIDLSATRKWGGPQVWRDDAKEGGERRPVRSAKAAGSRRDAAVLRIEKR